MIKLSVVIITYNEEQIIERCLLSVKNIADDIIVVDSFSTDRTEDICKKHQVKFIQHKFDGHIEQKNWAITQAKYPHILSLDADEVLSEKLKDSILAVKKNWEHDGYYFNRLNNYCGKWIRYCGWYPDQKLRLWDSRKGEWTGINPHDKYELQKGATQNKIKGDLLHYSYFSIKQHIEQVNKFTDISSLAHFNKGRKASLPEILIRSGWKFFKDYFLKGGFLDGYYGLVICITSSYATFLKYIKLKELWKNQNNSV